MLIPVKYTLDNIAVEFSLVPSKITRMGIIQKIITINFDSKEYITLVYPTEKEAKEVYDTINHKLTLYLRSCHV